MNNKFIVIVAMLAAASALGAQPAGKRKPITPEQYAANLERFLTKTGGYIVGPYTGRNVVIANAQKAVAAKALEDAAAVMSDGPHLVAKVVESDETRMAGLLADAETGVMVQVVDEVGMPTLLVAPDARWAKVNVRALAADGADGEKLAARVSRQVWRAVMMLMGASNSNFQPCLMQSYLSLAELDAAPKTPCPEPFDKVAVTAKKYGMANPRRTTYRNACREGWAPAPTNHYQKAIWEQVKADKERGPTNPIRILPPNQKK